MRIIRLYLIKKISVLLAMQTLLISFFWTQTPQIRSCGWFLWKHLAEAKKLLDGPNIENLPQQFNIAPLGPHTRCRVIRETRSPLSFAPSTDFTCTWPPGGFFSDWLPSVTSVHALPADSGSVNHINNPFDVAAYRRLCEEFFISFSTDSNQEPITRSLNMCCTLESTPYRDFFLE